MILIVISVKRTANKQKIALLYQQERIFKMMDSQSLLTEEDKKIITTKGKNGYQQIISISPKARIRAERVGLIGEALKNEKNTKIVEQLLGPFLTDRNNRVRANAAKAIYKHNKKVAFTSLEEMVKSQDKWFRVSAAWAIGVLKDAEFATLLVPLLTDVDQHVRQKAIKSMKNIISNNLPQVIAALQKRISKEVERASEKLKEIPKPVPITQLDRLKELRDKLKRLSDKPLFGSRRL